MPPVERVAELAPLSITPVDAPGLSRWTFDFGTNVGGRVRLQLPAAGDVMPGHNITLKHAEALSHPPYAPYDGSAWMGSLFWAWPVDSYITSGGDGGGSFEPAFTDHGFRYVEMSVEPPLPQPPTTKTLTAVVLRTAARPQSKLVLGNALLQALSNASWWTESAALKGIPQGAAARGERTGWTGDAAFASESELVDFDTGAFFSQFLAQIQQLQCPDGTVGSCIPNTDPHRDGWPVGPASCSAVEADPSWGTVYPTIAWGVWKYYDARGVISRHYPSLKTYMRMLETRINATGGLGNIFCAYGDWNPIQKTSCHVTAAGTYLHNLINMAEMAEALGESGDAADFAAKLSKARVEYHTVFWNPALGLYASGTQVAQAVALWTGVASAAGVAGNVSAWLGKDLVSTGLTFGFIGVRYVYEALVQNGQLEPVLRALLRTDFPSYGAELFNMYEPSTTLWETWDADTHRQWLDESSRNHHYQASINTFLRKALVGLDMPAGAAAWSTVAVKPFGALPLPQDLAAALPFARATVQSFRGLYEVSWQRSLSGGISLNVTLPSGSEGVVSIPKSFGADTICSEGGRTFWEGGSFVPGVPGIITGVDGGNFVDLTVTSGAFVFSTKSP